MAYNEHNGNKGIRIRVGHDVDYERAVAKADKLQRRANKNLERKINREYRKGFAIPSIFKVVLLILCVSLVVSFIKSGNVISALSFESLLDFLTDVPTVNWNWLDMKTVVLDLPSWLDWLDNVVNFFAQIIEFFGFILAGLWQAVNFIIYFLDYLFLA